MQALQRLQEWYGSQCNGDWEHSFGVKIGTLDNPGWSLRIDLSGTRLADQSFAEVKRNYEHPIDWLICFVRDGQFQGACGPHRLEEMLGVFFAWADSYSTSRA